ncbi:helix-turn-helix domain-containing protein [Massilia orientalis]|uniref:Helix-turn-helix domain-containing protein n=1 Tax=Massilia orientalis TaxID=3050128 RepID=A0ACC7MCG1_9BURK|nr:helix-turn-helix domain-containing protein [Massilia sp. YIM B02787]
MSSERADQPATPDNQPPVHGVPGQVLARQREAMGWSVEQVADQLKLAVRQVIALEAGDYASLPSPAVTRGFVRAYAKLVKVDPAPLVAQIAMETEPAPDTSAVTANRRPTPTSFSQSKFPSHGKRSSLPLGMIAGAVVVVVAAAAAAWHFGFVPGGQHAETGTTVATPAATGASTEAANGSSVEVLQNPAVPLISVPGPSASASAPATTAAPGAVVNVPGTTATGAPPTTVPTAPAAAPGATSPATPAPAATAPAAPAAAGANALVLNVREDSWIEVRPAKGGAPLFSRLVKAGSTETVNVEQPVRVTVGNPGGVTAMLRGTAVALPPVPGKTLSRVNLQ